jgi:serine/threonine protein kinase
MNMNTVNLSMANVQPLTMNEGSVSGASGLGVALVRDGQGRHFILKYATNSKTAIQLKREKNTQKDIWLKLNDTCRKYFPQPYEVRSSVTVQKTTIPPERALLMSLAPGKQVYQLVKQNQITSDDARIIMSNIRNALNCMHSVGYLHNDAHLGNMYYDKATKTTTLIDFGNATKIAPYIHDLRAPLQSPHSRGRRTVPTDPYLAHIKHETNALQARIDKKKNPGGANVLTPNWFFASPQCPLEAFGHKNNHNPMLRKLATLAGCYLNLVSSHTNKSDSNTNNTANVRVQPISRRRLNASNTSKTSSETEIPARLQPMSRRRLNVSNSNANQGQAQPKSKPRIVPKKSKGIKQPKKSQISKPTIGVKRGLKGQSEFKRKLISVYNSFTSRGMDASRSIANGVRSMGNYYSKHHRLPY